jgi:hypothetical protein
MRYDSVQTADISLTCLMNLIMSTQAETCCTIDVLNKDIYLGTIKILNFKTSSVSCTCDRAECMIKNIHVKQDATLQD